MSTLMQPDQISAVRRQFLKAGDSFSAHAAVFETISDRMLGRLELLAIQPKRVLDLGCRTGYQFEALAQRYPQATIVGADPAPGAAAKSPRPWSDWLSGKRRTAPRMVACDPHHLPFSDASFDLVVSNLLLPWCHAPHEVFSEVARVLGVDGVFMFASAGPDTLVEYRRVWSSIDDYLHGFGLIDMHDLGDAMMASGFSAPVLDRDNLMVDYPSLSALEKELRSLGAANLAMGRRRGLLAPGVMPLAVDADTASARFAVTLELVQGHGWKGGGRSSFNQAGDVIVSVDTLRGSRNSKPRR